MKKHVPAGFIMQPKDALGCGLSPVIDFCMYCGVIVSGAANMNTPCPPWAPAAKALEPGGLDRLGVVKELEAITTYITSHHNAVTRDGWKEAFSRLEQLISRLEGQGAEKPAAPEPKGQVLRQLGPCKVCGTQMMQVWICPNNRCGFRDE